MVCGAENEPRIKFLAEVGDLCVAQDFPFSNYHFPLQLKNCERNGKWTMTNGRSRAAREVVGDRSYCSEGSMWIGLER